MLLTKEKDLSEALKKGFDKARKKLIEEEKKRNGFLIVSDENGTIKKVPAKNL